MQAREVARRTARFAIIAGILGLIGVAFLVAALIAPTPSPGTMRRETNYFLWQDAFVILQAIAMIPVTIGLFRLTSDRGRDDNKALALGLVAQGALIITSGLIFTNTASDMLYMGPIGLVGLWLLLVNRPRGALTGAKVLWTGRVAGVGLILIGLGFLTYGFLVAPAIFVRPLSNAEIDAQMLTPANLISHLCLAAGTLLGRVVYPVWTLLLSKDLLGSNIVSPAQRAPVVS